MIILVGIQMVISVLIGRGIISKTSLFYDTCAHITYAFTTWLSGVVVYKRLDML